jgi:hypothetical protein
MVERKHEEDFGEDYGKTSVNVIVLAQQKYVVIACAKSA